MIKGRTEIGIATVNSLIESETLLLHAEKQRDLIDRSRLVVE
jgi:hypothetical protein